jgi:hypothetical protein
MSDIQVLNEKDLGAVEARDIDGDGRPEVLFVVVSDWGSVSPQHPQETGGQALQMQAFLLDGQTGKRRWSAPLTKKYDVTSSYYPYYPHGSSSRLEYIPHAFFDADSDHCLDVVLPAEAQVDKGPWQLRVLNGRTGALITETEYLHPVDSDRPMDNLSLPIVVDLDGDHSPEIVTLVFTGHWYDQERVPLIKAWSCKTADELWSWKPETPLITEGTFTFGGGADSYWRHRPQLTVANGPDGPVLIVNLWAVGGSTQDRSC